MATKPNNRQFLGLRDPDAPIDEMCDNVLAWRIGRAAKIAARQSAGDLIDEGLALIKALRDQGFDIKVR